MSNHDLRWIREYHLEEKPLIYGHLPPEAVTAVALPNAKHIGLMCDLGYAEGIRPSFFFPNFSRYETTPGEPHEPNHSTDQYNH